MRGWAWVAIASSFLAACGDDEAPGFKQVASHGGGAGGGAITTSDSTTGGGSAGSGGAGGAVEPPFSCAGKVPQAGTDLLQVDSGGLSRSVLVHVPPDYDESAGTPLVLNFHGFGSDAPQQALLSEMSVAADIRGLLVAYPYGVGMSWNAGQCCGSAWTDSVDDIAFVVAMIDALSERYCVDPRRIFATGMSNGGFLSHRIGCELADRVAAIAPVAGVLGIPVEECAPSRPMPVMHFHGTADPLVPYEGGLPLTGWDVEGVLDFMSVADSTQAWRDIDGCSAASDSSYHQGDSACDRWKDCAGGSEVILCTVEGGGHTWPGGMPIPPLGKTTEDMSATAMMLDFFAAHPLP